MDQSNILSWERQGDYGILSISNGKENYLDQPDFIDIELLRKWTSEEELKGIIIQGIGRNFSAGADLKNLIELAKNQNLLAEKINKGKKLLELIENLNIPVIASINGVCFGGGLEIALACHIRIASEKALFAFPETNHGLIPGLGGGYRIARLLRNKAFEIVLKGDMINAHNAKEIGLIDYISEKKDSFDLAMEKLKSFTLDRSIEVIHYAMQAIHNASRLSREEALKIETELFCKLAVKVKDRYQN
ncbi:MAG: enoyl-CoA hydratase/isomerase family protein [Bacteroidales bacterium]|nr:enoyl-CoA hydratase/isomerase family protein [Bacteroidales bacterium]